MPDEDWYSDGPKLNEEAKRLLSHFEGKVAVEFPELVGLSLQKIEEVKKLITAQYDEYVPNHARRKVRHPRRCIMYGTTNEEGFLRDLTGNRRFPIVECRRPLDFNMLKKERDQLWAEAVFMDFFMDEILEFTPEAKADQRKIQEPFLDINTEASSFMDKIAPFKHGWFSKEDVWASLGINYAERYKRTGPAQHVYKETRKLLASEGWARGTVRINNVVQRVFYKRAAHQPLRRIYYSPGDQHGSKLTYEPDNDVPA